MVSFRTLSAYSRMTPDCGKLERICSLHSPVRSFAVQKYIFEVHAFGAAELQDHRYVLIEFLVRVLDRPEWHTEESTSRGGRADGAIRSSTTWLSQ